MRQPTGLEGTACHTMSLGFVSKRKGEENHRPHVQHSYKYNYKIIHHNLKELIQQKTKKMSR